MSPRIIHIPLSGGDRKAQAKGHSVRPRDPRKRLSGIGPDPERCRGENP